MELKQPHRDWLDARGIDPELAAKFGLRSVVDHGMNWLAVPYVENGKTINHKYRVISDKTKQRMDSGAPLTLLNHDCLLDQSLDSQPLIITEGEWDFLATLTAGKRRVVSVPNGAPKEASDDKKLTEGARYEWFWRHEATLRRVKKVILAVDGDEPGKALAADLCRLFGPERCMFVTYPDHCKDPNDVALHHGHQALLEMLDAAKPYPIKGLYRASDIPEQPQYTCYPTGVKEVDELFQVVPRTFTVMTGYAGQGKTSFLMWLIANLIRRQVSVTIASFETDVKPIFVRKLKAALILAGEYSQHSQDDDQWAMALIEKHVHFILNNVGDDDQSLGVEEVLDLARASVIQSGSRLLLVDPWNEMDHKRQSGESETDYTGRAIRMFKRFAKENDMAVWIIAHPSKPFQGKGAATLPGLYDISGSANWANKADYGIVIQAKDREYWTTTVACTKVRMGLPGKIGKIVVQFDPYKSSYAYYGEMEE